VVPSGRLLSSRIRLIGSLTAGIWARLIALHRMSLLLLEGITYFYSGGRDNDAALALGGRPIQQHEPAARHSLNTIPVCDGQTHDDSIILHQHSVATRVTLGR